MPPMAHISFMAPCLAHLGALVCSIFHAQCFVLHVMPALIGRSTCSAGLATRRRASHMVPFAPPLLVRVWMTSKSTQLVCCVRVLALMLPLARARARLTSSSWGAELCLFRCRLAMRCRVPHVSLCSSRGGEVTFLSLFQPMCTLLLSNY